MDLSLQEIFERARAAQEWVPPMEADLLFAAALRMAVDQAMPLSPAKVVLREGGVLELVLSDTGPEQEQYLAPEIRLGDLKRIDARAEVYAAGAVGYELFTGLPPPQPPHAPGPELTGPLGDVVRVAMSRDRRERFGDLQQLFDAVSVIEPLRSPPEERGLLAALLARVKRWEERAQNAAALALLRHEHQSVEARLAVQEQITARLSAQPAGGERLAALESELQALRSEASQTTARLQQNLRELVEDRRREEANARAEADTKEAMLALHPPRSPLWSSIGAAVVAAVVASVATALVLERLHPMAMPTPIADAIAAPHPAPAAEQIAPTPQPSPSVSPPPQAAASDHAAVPNPASPPTPIASAPTNPSLAAAPAQLVGPDGSVLTTATPGANAPHPATVPPAAAATGPEPSTHDKARALLDRGDTALEKGRPATAVSAFRSALETDAHLSEAHRGLGMAYALQGNDAAAKREYESYLGANPNASDASDIRAAITELSQRSSLDSK